MSDGKVTAIVSKYSEKAKAGLPSPKVTLESIVLHRKYCAENACGCYGQYCSCPPLNETPEERLRVFGKYSKCAVVPMGFDVDYKDREAMDAVTEEYQKAARSILKDIRAAGIDTTVLAGGGCKTCAVCAAKEGKPCRNPDMQIQSVSCNGVKVNEVLASAGMEPVLKDGFVELYILALYN